MALRTSLGADQARGLIGAYGLVLERLEPLPAHGTVNSNFRVRASGRTYFLRLNEGKAQDDVVAEVRLIDLLRGRGVPTPEVLRTGDGRALVTAAARPALLFPWIEGHEAAPDTRRPETMCVVGEALGRLHRAGEGLLAAELPRNHYSLAGLRAWLAGFADEPRCQALVPRLAAELARAARRPPLPAGLIHQDLFPDNLLVDDAGQLLALLDFEQATFGPLIYDLAVAINAWCWDGEAISAAAMARLLAAYEAFRPLGAEERVELVAEARLAAARFAITRISDVYLPAAVDPELRRRKDYREYLDRLSFWEGHA